VARPLGASFIHPDIAALVALSSPVAGRGWGNRIKIFRYRFNEANPDFPGNLSSEDHYQIEPAATRSQRRGSSKGV